MCSLLSNGVLCIIIHMTISEDVFEQVPQKDMSQPDPPSGRDWVADQLNSSPDVGLAFSALKHGELPCSCEPMVSKLTPTSLVYIFHSKISNEVNLKPHSWLSLRPFMIYLKKQSSAIICAPTSVFRTLWSLSSSSEASTEKTSVAELLLAADRGASVILLKACRDTFLKPGLRFSCHPTLCHTAQLTPKFVVHRTICQ